MAIDLAAQKARIKQQQEKLARRLNAVTQKEKTEDRKRETRRKIVVGGAILSQMEKDDALANLVRGILARTVGRPIDQEAIADLLSPSPSNPMTPIAANDGNERSRHSAPAQMLDSAG
jgi:hypothetical protein